MKGFGVRLEKLLITPVFASGPLFINSCFSYCGRQNATKQGKCESTSTASSWWTVDSLTLEGHRGHRCDGWSCRFPRMETRQCCHVSFKSIRTRAKASSCDKHHFTNGWQWLYLTSYSPFLLFLIQMIKGVLSASRIKDYISTQDQE